MEFKAGDRVIRIGGNYKNVVNGRIYIIHKIISEVPFRDIILENDDSIFGSLFFVKDPLDKFNNLKII